MDGGMNGGMKTCAQHKKCLIASNITIVFKQRWNIKTPYASHYKTQKFTKIEAHI